MKTVNNICVAGGDLRQISIANCLVKNGFSVCTYGLDGTNLDKKINICGNMSEFTPWAEAVILPLPFSQDGIHISGTQLLVKELLKELNAGSYVLGGKLSEKFNNQAEKNEIEAIDYFNDEVIEIRNAVPTAEGALQIAMEKTLKTIYMSDCLVLGYGRIAKVLSHMLKCLGANVTVAARKQRDLAWIEINGLKPLEFAKLEHSAGGFDIIFNTVPAMVLNKPLLRYISQDCLIIDLASKPGGADFGKRRSIWALHFI